jgi:putative nucleotidyltransferase with HDIG domain
MLQAIAADGWPMSVSAPQSNGKVPLQESPRSGPRAAPAPGSRLAEAFEAVERYPVLAASCDRVITAATAETARTGEIIEAVESDVALAISVLRNANRSGLQAGGVAGIPAAVEALKPAGVLAIAGTAPSFDFFEPNGNWELKPERFRIHALATQRAADRIGRVVGWTERDELAVAALLHDVGRLVISRLHPGYKVYFDAVARTPEQRLREEREQLGIDHALVGGVLARRWNLPQRIAIAIERHHADDAEGLAAMVATADMVAHYCQGEAIAPERIRRRALRPQRGRPPRPPLRAAAADPGRDPDQRALPALQPRARRPPPSLRGHGLQADRDRNAPLGLDHPHPPPQRLRQDRRRRSRPGGADRPRQGVDLR